VVDLKIRLFELKGPDIDGIFRKAADRREMDKIKALMCSDVDWRPYAVDVHCVATLITTWFRDLPEPLLQHVPLSDLEAAQTLDSIPHVVKHIEEPKQSLLLWIWDICVLVSEKADVNKMNVTNLATIMVPSIYDCSSLNDPMQALMLMQKLQDFFRIGVKWRSATIDRNAFKYDKHNQDSNNDDAATHVNNASNAFRSNLGSLGDNAGIGKGDSSSSEEQWTIPDFKNAAFSSPSEHGSPQEDFYEKQLGGRGDIPMNALLDVRILTSSQEISDITYTNQTVLMCAASADLVSSQRILVS
jgi:hypothetical protein